jgi:transposase InsO family protein
LRLKNERNGDVVRAIRSDNGSEFKNTRFETFCHDLALEHQFSFPYVACQNGVVERENPSHCEMARTILDEHGTPRRYWAEAVNTACHVGNRIFLRTFLNKTCYELIHG